MLVGDREISAEPVTATLTRGDTENIEFTGNPFNVFKEGEIQLEEYEIVSDAEDIVSVNGAKLTAESEGTAHINIIDKVTNKALELTRVVIPPEQDRIDKILVNGIEATLNGASDDGKLIYRVELVTDENSGRLKIVTKDNTDGITIDNSTNWAGIGSLEKDVDLINKVTKIPIKIGIQNNEGNYIDTVDYILEVEKITNDTTLQEVTVTSTNADDVTEEIIATKVSEKRYEAIVHTDTKISLSKVVTNCEYSYISIDGAAYKLHEQTKNISVQDKDSVQVNFVVKSEAGTEEEYVLVIYRNEAILDLVSLKVEGKEAEKLSDTEYIAKVPKSMEIANVIALADSNLVEISIDGNEYTARRNEENIALGEDGAKVIITTRTADGSSKQIELTIMRISQNTNLLKVEVDGNEATLKEDGKYYYNLTVPTKQVLVRAQTEVGDPTDAWVKVGNAEYKLYISEENVNIIKKQTEVKIKVKAEDGSEEEHILIIESLPDDTNIQKVVINGEEALYIDGENRYEIRSKEDVFDIEVTLNDPLASMILGTNPKEIGIGRITVNKEAAQTIVEVIVTSQSTLETEKYEIVISEKSSNSNLDFVKVNDKIITSGIDGNYRVQVVNATTQINIEAVAEDIYAKTSIDGNTDGTSIAKLSENVVEGKTVYTYQITVVSENGKNTNNHLLIVEVLEANYNIVKVNVGEEELTLEEAQLREDGSYYYKIGRVEEGYVKVELESQKSKVKVNGSTDDVVLVNLPNEINEIPITVIGEDKTQKEIMLVIEKKSSDTSIISVTGEHVLSTDIQEFAIFVYIDEDLSKENITIKLNNENAKIRLVGEDETGDETDEMYTQGQIMTEVDFAGYDATTGINLNVRIKAEDGSIEDRIITVYKKANLELESVAVNSENIEYDEENEMYYAVVPNKDKPQVVITPKSLAQKVQLLNSSGTVLGTATGALSLNLTLSTGALEDEYIIRVTSHNGADYGTADYKLKIRQKSIEVGIVYVKLDGLGTMVSEDGTTYSSSVSGKEEYPTEIKLKDEKAEVRIEDLSGNVLIPNAKGILKSDLAIPDGESEYKIIVTAENGNTAEYKLKVERISSNVEIESITFTDYDTDWKTIITKNETEYNEETKTYRIVVNKHLANTTLTVKAESGATTVTLDNSTSGLGTVALNKALNFPQITKVAVKLTASDGSSDIRYIEILPDPKIYVIGKIITENVNKEHVSEISVYKLESKKEKIATLNTELDGTFRVLIYTPEDRRRDIK